MAPMIHRTRHPSGTRSISSQEDMFLHVLGQHIIRGEEGQVGIKTPSDGENLQYWIIKFSVIFRNNLLYIIN